MSRQVNNEAIKTTLKQTRDRRKYQVPVVANECPADGNTAREKVRDTIRQMQKEYPNLRERVFTAICRADFDDWLVDHIE